MTDAEYRECLDFFLGELWIDGVSPDPGPIFSRDAILLSGPQDGYVARHLAKVYADHNSAANTSIVPW